MDISIFIIGFLIVFISAFIQGITGFGFAVVAVPLLSLFIPLQLVVPIVIVLCILINFYIYYKERANTKLQDVKVLLIFILIGTPLGSLLLLFVNDFYLKIATGALVLLFGACLYKGKTVNIKNERAANIVVGSISGILNGSIGLMGLPIALLLTNQKTDKHVFRGNIALLGVIVSILTVIHFSIVGLMTTDVFQYSLLFLVALVIGGIVGVKIDKFIKQALFVKISTLVIMISGIFTLVFAGLMN